MVDDEDAALAWSEDACGRAQAQGWNVFHYDGSDLVRIQPCQDAPSPFRDDETAIGFVRRQAARGDRTCILALALHARDAEAIAMCEAGTYRL